MDNTGFTLCIGLVAATATATATTAYAFALTLREYRNRLESITEAVANLIQERQRMKDRIGSLERDLSWLLTPGTKLNVGAADDGTQQDSNAPWL